MRNFVTNPALSNNSFAFADYLKSERALENYHEKDNHTFWANPQGHIVAYATYDQNSNFEVFTPQTFSRSPR